MQGRIVKGIAGFYYVTDEQSHVYECKAKGNFRAMKIKPLVGDYVEFEVIDEENAKGNIVKIQERKNELIRPEVSNVDQALVVFAMNNPEPNFGVLDRFLLRMEFLNLPVKICFNKIDVEAYYDRETITETYRSAGYDIFFVCVKTGEGVEQLKEALSGRCTVLAGPSGVGKSSLSNLLTTGEIVMETGDVSRKNQRGKQTTRFAQLLPLKTGGYLMDTPGFTSLMVEDLTGHPIFEGYPEMREYEPFCRFAGCSHIGEPDCGIKNAVAEGKISKIRYENYVAIYKEVTAKKKY